MQNLFRRVASLTAVGTALLLAGCAPSIQGKWSGNIKAGQTSVAATLEFKPDGTMTQTVKAPMVGDVNVTGTYKVNNDTVDITVKDAALSPEAMSKVPAPMQAMVKEQIKQGLAKNPTKSIKFKVEGDKLEMTENGQSLTFDKVKQ